MILCICYFVDFERNNKSFTSENDSEWNLVYKDTCENLKSLRYSLSIIYNKKIEIGFALKVPKFKIVWKFQHISSNCLS